MNFLYVFVGGGLGSLCRYGIAILMRPYVGQLPYATFVANAISCIILGFLFAYNQRVAPSNIVALLLMTGFCGGFSTFSTFSLETFNLINDGYVYAALVNVFASVLICLGAVLIGFKLGT